MDADHLIDLKTFTPIWSRNVAVAIPTDGRAKRTASPARPEPIPRAEFAR
jgi:hypothetical protein